MFAVTMISWIMMSLTICCLSFVHVGYAKTHFMYMTNYCSKSMEVKESLLVALTPEDKLPKTRADRDFIHCDVDLVAPKDMKLFVHFLQLSISPKMKHTDRLQLYDMKPAKRRLTPDKGLYGKLDRSLLLFDASGAEIDDYRTSSDELRLDYLGKPSKKSPGFRVLITAFSVPDSSGQCPDRHYLCKRRFICIPRQVACDGYPNCGEDDTGDEEGCDRDDTVTDLLAEYSLAKDIIVVVLLPLIIFIGIVIVIFCVAKRYIREKITKPLQLPSVHFTPKKDGQITISETHQLSRLYAPPSYEDLMHPPNNRYEPPPAYSSLADLVRAGTVDVVDSEDEAKVANLANERRRRHERNLRSSKTGSNSSLEEKGSTGGLGSKGTLSEYDNYRLHCMFPSDTDDDEETKQKRRRKGGKCKSKSKRRSDQAMIALHGISPLATPDSSSPSHSVPSSDSAAAAAASATTADSSTPSASSPDLPPQSITTSIPSSVSKHHSKPHNKRYINRGVKEDFIPIHFKPNKSSSSSPARVPCKVEITSECQKSETSSCGDTDPKSETESRATSKRNSKTESLTSLADKSGSRRGLYASGDLQEADENGDDFSNRDEDEASLSKVKLISNGVANNDDDDDDADVSSESESESTAAIGKLKSKLAPVLPVESQTNGHVARV